MRRGKSRIEMQRHYAGIAGILVQTQALTRDAEVEMRLGVLGRDLRAFLEEAGGLAQIAGMKLRRGCRERAVPPLTPGRRRCGRGIRRDAWRRRLTSEQPLQRANHD